MLAIDESIGQSAAINFYIASETGLMGSSTLEAAKIISISEHLKELNTAWRSVVAWGKEASAEDLDKWFDSGATDVTGIADRAGQPTRYAKWFMGRIEATLGDGGFAVGSKLSLADVLLYYTFAEQLKASEVAEGTPAWRMEPFCSAARTSAALASYPKISASCANVAANENFQRWLSTRGVQQF